jgi:hypothetical protein
MARDLLLGHTKSDWSLGSDVLSPLTETRRRLLAQNAIAHLSVRDLTSQIARARARAIDRASKYRAAGSLPSAAQRDLDRAESSWRALSARGRPEGRDYVELANLRDLYLRVDRQLDAESARPQGPPPLDGSAARPSRSPSIAPALVAVGIAAIALLARRDP